MVMGLVRLSAADRDVRVDLTESMLAQRASKECPEPAAIPELKMCEVREERHHDVSEFVLSLEALHT